MPGVVRVTSINDVEREADMDLEIKTKVQGILSFYLFLKY
jgi:hypothetical protein